MAKFQLLGGQHIQDGPDGKERKYFRGNTVESNIDLATRWPEKFQRVFDETPVSEGMLTKRVVVTEHALAPMKAPPLVPGQPVPTAVKDPPSTDTLSAMSVTELKKFAEEEEIDLKGAKTAAEMLKVISAATK